MTSMADVIKAADFAAIKHRDQRRKGPDKAPYINHPIGVANILANEGKANLFLIISLSSLALRTRYCFCQFLMAQPLPSLSRLGAIP